MQHPAPSPASAFNRWRIPPAALAVHLCIGMAYGFSVFWLPMSRLIGGPAGPVACPEGMSLWDRVFAVHCDWPVSWLSFTFTLFFVFLGGAAALFGDRAERAGPRKSALTAALCWGGGLALAGLGVHLHQITLFWLGAGVIGGVGLGLGYISPVSALMKWFPDKKGMAAGLAIMGFGGGAMIGAPLADQLMKWHADPLTGTPGVAATLFTLAALHFLAMTAGALGYRRAPSSPTAGVTASVRTPPRAAKPYAVPDNRYVTLGDACRSQAFMLLWAVLFCNVAAGIGVLGMASPMIQEMFGGTLIGAPVAFDALTPDQLKLTAAVAAGFTGLLSLFNICGRFFWASVSDRLGRKTVFGLFFALGCALYVAAPYAGAAGSLPLFVTCFCVILSMYGGGFALAPAYLADLFGTTMVGAIHGRLLTAWSAAAVAGPFLVSFLRERALHAGVAPARVYDVTLYVLAGVLVVGFACNYAVRRANPELWRETNAPDPRTAPHLLPADKISGGGNNISATAHLSTAAAWTAVALPLLWGVWMTLKKVAPLLGG